ncbi:MAG TPA: TIGR03960 family B12-binding radical SAM protein [Polyangiaceae bacterium]|jgi:radical SAM family uncharacterized protein/radical SAM-linked protein
MQHPYADFVHLVQKPARYLGGEHGSNKKDWDSPDLRARVCLAFPDVYDIGMSHLGFKILYKILNDDPRTLAERCYAPWVDMEAELRKRGVPLVTLENARPLRDFDVVGFSLQFELTYTNVLMMLDLGGVPLRSADRGDSDPLVIAGGPTATHPEPLSAFIDAFVIGDGEEAATEIALAWTSMRDLPRQARLREIGKMRGVYVPSLHSTHIDPDTGFVVVDDDVRVERNMIDDLDRFPFPDDSPIGGPEAIFDRMSIEIARGCTEGCRFCQAGMIYRPVRERDPEKVVETLVSAVKKSGYDEVSLTSLSTADYSCIAPLVQRVSERLAPERVSLGVSSLRAYGLGEQTLDDMQRVRASGITFAPEAGSQRMRDVVNKNVTEEQLMQTAERIFSRNWSSMKLYFMIGLPTEEEDDVREIVRVGKRAREVGFQIKRARGAPPPTVTVSVSTHVPKPHTPFQWCAMDDAAVVRQKQSWLEEEVRGSRVDLRMHDSDGSWLEGVFARGDRTLCDVLETAYRDGARFDSWDDRLDIAVWERAFATHRIEPKKFLGTIPVTARLPWSHIDVGLEEGFLLAEYRKSLKSRLSPPCGKVAGAFIHPTNLEDAKKDDRKLVCYDCGVGCDLTTMREERETFLVKLRAEKPRAVLPKPEAPKPKAPPKRIEQGAPHRYRFAFTKLGPSAFLSHLDLIRALPRAFRRAGLPLFYTSGFHPKADMTFSPALSLGVMSLGEIVDVKLTCTGDPREWLDAMTEGAPEGLRFVDARALVIGEPSLSKVIDVAQYAVAIPRRALDESRAREAVAAALAAESLPIVRTIEGIGKKVDVRRYLRAAAWEDPRAQDAIERAGLAGDLAAAFVEIAVTPTGSAKISEAVEVIFGREIPAKPVRVALLGGQRSPLDVSSSSHGDARDVAPA